MSPFQWNSQYLVSGVASCHVKKTCTELEAMEAGLRQQYTMLAALGSHWGWIIKKRNCTRVCLQEDQDHVFKGGLCLIVLTVSKVDCCIDTSSNEPYWRGNCNIVGLNQIKQLWCANTLRLNGITQSLVVNFYTNLAQYNYIWPENNT